MAKLIYRNEKGASLAFGERAPFLITAIEGLGGPQNLISTSKSPFQDGNTITHTSLSDRHIVLTGVIIEHKRVDRDAHRRTLLSTFNPKLKGELVINRNGVTRKIACVPELAPHFASNMQDNFQEFSIQLYCASPYWEEDVYRSVEIASWSSGMKFPLKLPTEFATKGSGVVNVINKGDVETPMTIEISGRATNPKLINRETNEFIKINRKLQPGDKLSVTTAFGNKRVEENGLNVFNYIDLNSTFLQLAVGDNIIVLETDDVDDEVTIRITYKNRYLGV